MAPLSLVLFTFFIRIIYKKLEIFDRKLKWIFILSFIGITFIASFYHIWGIIKLPTKEISMIFTIVVNVLMTILFLVFKNFSKFKIKFFKKYFQF